MSEEPSAFTLKDRPKEVTAESLTPKKIENPLNNELSADEQTVTRFEFYFDRILSGQITSQEELVARLEQRIKTTQDGSRYLARPDRDFLRSPAGRVFSLTPEELIPIKDPEQKELLIRLATETVQSRAEQQAANQEVRGLGFYTDRILSGQITSQEELVARLEQRIKTTQDGSRYLARPDRDFLRSPAGRVFSLTPEELIPIKDPEQKELLLRLGTLILDKAVPDEAKTLLSNYIRSGGKVELNRLRLLLAARQDPFTEKIEAFIEDFDSIKGRIDLRKQFYDTLSSDDSIAPSLGILNSFEGQSVKDLSLVAELRQRALGARRTRVSNEFASSLATPQRDFGETLKILQSLSVSDVPEDAACAEVLVKSLYRLEIAENRQRIREMITLNVNPRDIYRFIDTLPIRPSVGDFNFLKAQNELKDRLVDILPGVQKISRLKTANSIRRGFVSQDVESVLERIQGFPQETEEEMATKTQLIDLYRTYAAANNSQMFDERFAQDIISRIETDLKEAFERPELGRNLAAYRYVAENFLNTMFILGESFRDDPRTRDILDKILVSRVKVSGENNPRLKFIQRIEQLEKQRPLTDIERNYLQSVELLTSFNPYLVAVLNADTAATAEFLRHHSSILSQETTAGLTDGTYVPLLQVGTGPNGLAALGELVRNNPRLAEQVLVVDSGEQPGGPFAIPNGPAWELNSANQRGAGGAVMPDLPRVAEQKTVRSYGSPVARYFPGERVGDSDTRTGSINTTVDTLPAPDVFSNGRYPTNEELQIILSLQTALLARKLALRTELISVEPNTNSEERGNKIATLKITEKDGSERVVKIKTDAIFDSSGLGDPTYGFTLQGSRAESVIEATKDSAGFPKITTTLEGFKGFADRNKEKVSPGKTLAIWGKGNSADTLIEYVGNLFQGENPLVRDVTKIYVITGEGDLSQRPRYAQIRDLRPRGGRGNLVEFVRSRVGDVDFATKEGDPQDRPIVVIDTDGKVITDREGKPIMADAGIAATGFRPQLEKVYASYLNGRSLNEEGDESPLQQLRLPTNSDVVVGDTFRVDPNIVILGTASTSKSRFTSLEVLNQLPEEAAEALVRNGVENAVAIGFNAPSVQAAVLIWLGSRIVQLEEAQAKSIPQIPLSGTIPPETVIEVPYIIRPSETKIPDNITADDLVLSPVLAYTLRNRFELEGLFSGELGFQLTYSADKKAFEIVFKDGVEGLSSEFVDQLKASFSDEDVQRYTADLLRKIRRNPRLDINLAFARGKVNPKDTFVQTTGIR